MHTNSKHTSTIPLSFSQYLDKLDGGYLKQIETIPLFNNSKTSVWNENQKRNFAAIFYHLRGHFIDFLWYLGNTADDETTKSIVMENISEEFGGTKFSHEKLYARFAKECGVDIDDEIINETNYLDFAKKFNKGHLTWLASHDADERLSAFAAYERLDNIDYPYLSTCADSINISSQGKTFFRVHVNVEHFSSTFERLLPIWEENPEKIKAAFDFIFSHQLDMWRKFSDTIFSIC